MGKIIKANKTLDDVIKAAIDCHDIHVDSEFDIKSVTENLHWIESMFPGRVVILCHLKHIPAAPYVSKWCEEILGYTKKEFQSFSPEDFFSLIHPEDVDEVISGFRKIEEFSRKRALHQLRFIFYYRIKHKDGHYIYARDERVTVLTQNKRLVFFILLDKNDFGAVNNTTFEVFEISRAGLRKVNTQISPSLQPSFTPRELDVVQLIIKGLNNKEIANYLSISASTVKKHRYSLFKKTNVKNSHALINYAKIKNLVN